ncbi:MAG: 16S rRNA (cytosine(1402)-N(4))-methyltransferase RsmH [Thermoanaerobacteraceae bacterium]|nr:16S rRNA (cytosine(1402)-N(4))-methyltransferase RsmH [Thermoanaerobacteraceae bacterium]
MEFVHKPIMLEECMELLQIKPDGTYVDCTLGGGGHSVAIARRLGNKGRLIGLDQDPQAIEAAGKRLQPYKDKVTLIRSNFVHLSEVLHNLDIVGVDGVLFDLGISSPQVDRAERGFSYQQDAELDMRMDPEQKVSAKDLVNQLDEKELARIIKNYGEEKWAARIARFIVEARRREEIRTTGQLVDIIKQAIPAGARKAGPHPAKRTFQALRIAVNRELEVLPEALNQAVDLLNSGGRIVVISFHSLEDRIVKQTFKERAQDCACPPGLPVCTCNARKELNILTKKPLEPSREEIDANPRARSAKVRAAEKV